MSSTNTANVIERVLNSKTIFNYLFVTKFPITNVSNGCFGFECDILERNVERTQIHNDSGAPNDNFRENICSEDDLRSKSF